jgi:uncharacterized cupin superfamily protein
VADRGPVQIVHAEDFERTGGWRLVRRSLGLESFGINVVEIAPGDSIPEHDEIDRDQEEVFVALSGEPTLVVDGAEYPLRKGTFARLDPEPRRTVVNTGGEPALVLIMSAPRSSGYVPMDWA